MILSLHRQRVWAGWLATLGSAIALLGLCYGSADRTTPQRAAVTGRVMHNGQPVHDALICFDSDRSHCATCKLNPDGSFLMKGFDRTPGVVPGRYRIHFLRLKENSQVASKYKDAKTSELEIDVQPDWNQFTLNLL